MNIGEHIPAYMLLERFAKHAQIVDLYPPDEQGASLLAVEARRVVVVQPGMPRFAPSSDEKLVRVTAELDALPLARSAFDVVVCFALEENATAAGLDAFLKSARSLANLSGIVALIVPNRDSRWLDPGRHKDLPGFFDIERLLRRHFPHVSLFAQRPLHGAVLSPIGRTQATEAPLLDDRMLPADGEAASHFVALCSQRYRKTVDSTIVQLPSSLLAEHHNESVKNLKDMLTVARGETQSLSREMEQMTRMEHRLHEALESAEQLRLINQQTEKNLSDAERQIELRDQMLADAREAQQVTAAKVGELEQVVHEDKVKLRRQERHLKEAERLEQLMVNEREDAEKELAGLKEGLRAAQTQLKAKQRELDDVREQMAGLETELEALHHEASNQRSDLLAVKEVNRRLELELKASQDNLATTSALEAEIERLRALSRADRERMERRLEEEHRRLLDEMEKKERIESYAGELEKQIDELVSATRRNEGHQPVGKERSVQSNPLSGEIVAEGASGGAHEDEVTRLARERAEKIKRQRHQIEVLLERADQAERRADAYKSQLDDLQRQGWIQNQHPGPRGSSAPVAGWTGTPAEPFGKESNPEMALLETDLSIAVSNLAGNGARVTSRPSSSAPLYEDTNSVETDKRHVQELEAALQQHGEEIARLQAELAARASAPEQDKRDIDFKRALAEQEALIAEMSEEREALRATCERQRRSLEIRKKNLRQIAALLRKERASQSPAAAADSDSSGAGSPGEIPSSSPPVEGPSLDNLLAELDEDLASSFSEISTVKSTEKDNQTVAPDDRKVAKQKGEKPGDREPEDPDGEKP